MSCSLALRVLLALSVAGNSVCPAVEERQVQQVPFLGRAVPQSIRCYDRPNFTGNNLLALYDTPDLGQWRGRFQSCCVNGAWLLHQKVNYNQWDQFFRGGTYFTYGHGKCETIHPAMTRRAHSLRMIGAAQGIHISTLTFYAYPGYSGPEVTVNFGQSAIITGCTPYTIYNDFGQAVCLVPDPGQVVSPGFCWPTFFADLHARFAPTRYTRVRRGCAFSHRRVYGLSEDSSRGGCNVCRPRRCYRCGVPSDADATTEH